MGVVGQEKTHGLLSVSVELSLLTRNEDGQTSRIPDPPTPTKGLTSVPAASVGIFHVPGTIPASLPLDQGFFSCGTYNPKCRGSASILTGPR